MDGINGITGGYSLVILAALAYINKEVVTFVEADFIYTVICSVLVFCFFNFRKRAKCFAGDVGSVSIAFILLFLIGRLIIETEDFSWIVLLSVYGVDSVLTIIHRLMLHENIGLPHRKHLYQIMANELKIPHVIVSLAYMTIQTLIIVGYIYCQRYGYIFLIGCILLLSAIYVLFMKKYFSRHISGITFPLPKVIFNRDIGVLLSESLVTWYSFFAASRNLGNNVPHWLLTTIFVPSANKITSSGLRKYRFFKSG